MKKYTVGKIYIGDKVPFASVTVVAPDRATAVNMAVNYLKPNVLQTLTIVLEELL